MVQRALNPWDTQSARIFSPDGVYHTLNSREKSGLDRSGVLAFSRNASGDVTGKTCCIQGNCIDRADTAGCNGRGWNDEDVCYTLNTIDRPAVLIENHHQDNRVRISEDGICQTLSGRMGTGGNNTPMVMTPVCVGNGQADNTKLHEMAPSLSTMHDQQAVMAGSVVRRLTPLECERLQGYPDGWTDIGDWIDSKGKRRTTSDAARYKALGNSIALPYWRVMLSRMIRYCREGTMASLFDGIGGFPLCWAQVGGATLWASEIEEFTVAVTKRRFGEEDKGIPGDWETYIGKERT